MSRSVVRRIGLFRGVSVSVRRHRRSVPSFVSRRKRIISPNVPLHLFVMDRTMSRMGALAESVFSGHKHYQGYQQKLGLVNHHNTIALSLQERRARRG